MHLKAGNCAKKHHASLTDENKGSFIKKVEIQGEIDSEDGSAREGPVVGAVKADVFTEMFVIAEPGFAAVTFQGLASAEVCCEFFRLAKLQEDRWMLLCLGWQLIKMLRLLGCPNPRSTVGAPKHLIFYSRTCCCVIWVSVVTAKCLNLEEMPKVQQCRARLAAANLGGFIDLSSQK